MDTKKTILTPFNLKLLKTNSLTQDTTLFNGDTVSQVYLGLSDNLELTNKLRNRLFWIANNVRGNNILDVGTSQGIMPILLAREGKNVTAIDIDETSLDFARKELKKEDEATRERVIFKRESFVDIDCKGLPFDAIIAGEIIEHLVKQIDFFEICARNLHNRGQFIVTTPFGINPHWDHKITIFPKELVDNIEKFFEVSDFIMDEGYIKIIGYKKNKNIKKIKTEEILEKTEIAIYNSQEQSFKQNAEKNYMIEMRDELIEEQKDKISSLEKSVIKSGRELSKLNKKLERKTIEISKIETEILASSESYKNQLLKIINKKDLLLFEKLNNYIDQKIAEQKNKNAASLENYENRLLKIIEKRDQLLLDKINNSISSKIAAYANKNMTMPKKENVLLDIRKLNPSRLNRNGAVELTEAAITFNFDLVPSTSYEIILNFDGNTPNKYDEVLAAFAFFDIMGNKITPEIQQLQSSEKVGLFTYLRPNKFAFNTYRINFDVPFGVQSVIMGVLIWNINNTKYYMFPNIEISQQQRNINKIDVKNDTTIFSKEVVKKGEKVSIYYYPLGINFTNVEEIRFNLNKNIRFHIPVEQADFIELYPDLYTEDHRNQKAILLVVSFRDEASKLIPFNSAYLSTSEKYANHTYLIPEKKIEFLLPKRCSSIFVDILKWNSNHDHQLTLPLKIKKYRNSNGRASIWQMKNYIQPQPTINKANPNVIAILDKFSETILSYDLNLTLPTPKDYKILLEQNKFDFVLIESAWFGNNKSWSSAMTDTKNQKHNILKDFIKEAKLKNLKVVFWNKEDPPNFEKFIHTAKLCDFIFTTASECINEYKKICGNNNVFPLSFFAQPKIHNPIGRILNPEPKIAFAGSWYSGQLSKRREQMEMLLDAAMLFDFTIFDRMSEWNGDKKFHYPSKYEKHIQPSLTYDEMLAVHKNFEIFLNVNSVDDSQTMFSRRIFELLACSSTIISTPSRGIEKIFGNTVQVVKNKKDAENKITEILNYPHKQKIINHKGYREIHLKHTAKDRIDYIHKKLSIPYAHRRTKKLVTWAAPTNRPENIPKIAENFYRQSYKDIELIIGLNKDNIDIETIYEQFDHDPRVKVLKIPEKNSLGFVLNSIINESNGDYWFKIDDDNIYLENYTLDMTICFDYSCSSVIGKQAYFCYLESSNDLIIRNPKSEHQYVELVCGGSIACEMSVFKHNTFEDVSVGEDTKFLKNHIKNGNKIYSTDCFNFVSVRHESKMKHTWKADDEELIKGSKWFSKGLSFDLFKA